MQKIASFSFSIDQLVCLSFNNEEIIQLKIIRSIELDTEMILNALIKTHDDSLHLKGEDYMKDQISNGIVTFYIQSSCP